MAISLTEDFKTAEELGSNVKRIFSQLRATGRPVVITCEGKPAVVMLSVDAFERMVHNMNLARLLAEGEQDVRAGRTRPVEEFMKEFCQENKISTGGRRAGKKKPSSRKSRLP